MCRFLLGLNMGLHRKALDVIEKEIDKIRIKLNIRLDADEDDNSKESEAPKKKSTALGTRLPYGLCKDLGIDTTGMTPREAWEAYYEKTGVKPSGVIEEKTEEPNHEIDPGSGESEKEEIVPEEKEKSKEKKKYEDMDDSELENEKKSLEDTILNESDGWVDTDSIKKFSDGQLEKLVGAGYISEENLKNVKNAMASLRDVEAEMNKRTYGGVHEVEFDYQSNYMKLYTQGVSKPKMDTSVKSLQNWAQRATEYCDAHAQAGEMLGFKDPVDLINCREKFQNIIDGAELCVNINSAYLSNVLSEHLKNQFETGTTGGSTDLDARRDMANNLFGIDYDTSPVDREKFGYLADYGDYEHTLGHSGPGYGNGYGGYECCVTLRKDTVANRATYTVGDSLSSSEYWSTQCAAGAIDTTCSIEGLNFSADSSVGSVPDHIEEIPKKVLSGEYSSVANILDDNFWVGYVECQYHGDITAKDIESLRFNDHSQMVTCLMDMGDDALKICADNDIQFGCYKYNEEEAAYELKLYDGKKVVDKINSVSSWKDLFDEDIFD